MCWMHCRLQQVPMLYSMIKLAQYSFRMTFPWKFYGLKQDNYHQNTFSMNRNLWSYLFSTLYNKQDLTELHVVRVPNLALLSEYSLHTGFNAAGFPVRHCLPDYLPLCRVTFLIRSLIYIIILPMLHEDLKLLVFKFAITGWRQVLKIGFHTIEAYLLLIVSCQIQLFSFSIFGHITFVRKRVAAAGNQWNVI